MLRELRTGTINAARQETLINRKSDRGIEFYIPYFAWLDLIILQLAKCPDKEKKRTCVLALLYYVYLFVIGFFNIEVTYGSDTSYLASCTAWSQPAPADSRQT